MVREGLDKVLGSSHREKKNYLKKDYLKKAKIMRIPAQCMRIKIGYLQDSYYVEDDTSI